MSPELKEKWIAALRSGKYQQGRRVMRRGDKFCCLGVLCDVAGFPWHPNTENEFTVFSNQLGTSYIESHNLFQVDLPSSIHNAAYLMNDGTLTKNQLGLENRTYTFAEIADWLEKHNF